MKSLNRRDYNMDDSKFFKLQYKPQSNKIYALHFTGDNLSKLIKYLNKFGLEAHITCSHESAMSMHIHNGSLDNIGNIDVLAWIGNYIIFVIDNKHKIQKIEVKNSLSQIIEEYCIVMKDEDEEDEEYDQDETYLNLL
jgi:hypothetical protein